MYRYPYNTIMAITYLYTKLKKCRIWFKFNISFISPNKYHCTQASFTETALQKRPFSNRGWRVYYWCFKGPPRALAATIDFFGVRKFVLVFKGTALALLIIQPPIFYILPTGTIFVTTWYRGGKTRLHMFIIGSTIFLRYGFSWFYQHYILRIVVKCNYSIILVTN